MIVTINRAEFLDAAKRAASIAPSESPLDVLKGALMEADAVSGKLTITSTNMEVALEEKLPCSVQEEGSMVFSSKMLTEMLQRLPLDIYNHTTDGWLKGFIGFCRKTPSLRLQQRSFF